VAQKFYFAILQTEVTRASRSLSAIAELLVSIPIQDIGLGSVSEITYFVSSGT